MKIASWMLLAAVLGSPWCVGRAHASALPASGAASSPGSASANVTVTGDKTWVDTGMDVSTGDKLHITATGTVNMGNNTGVTPNGVQRGWVDTLRPLMVPSAGRGALVGRIGNSDAATPFLVGADGTILVPFGGRLYLGINQDQTQAPDGKYQVHIDRIASSAATASGAAAGKGNYDFKPLFAMLDKSLPYRVTDKPEGGNPGDLVNFVIIGSQEQVTNALKTAELASGRQDQH